MGNWPASPNNGDTTTNELGTQFQYSSSRGAWLITYQTIGNPSYGECYVSTPASTTLTTQSTYYLLEGTTTEGNYLLGFTHASPGRLTYTGADTKKFLVSAYISTTVGHSSQEYAMRLAKGGTTIVTSADTLQVGATAQHNIITSQTIVELATNNYIEIYVSCTTRATSSLTANNGNLIIRSL